MNRASALRRRFFFAGFALAFFMAALCAFLPTKAAEPPDTLKVYAQYWADPDSKKLLKEFTRAELEELSNGYYGYEGYFCNVTRVNTVMRIHARGVILAEFLREGVGVDLNSVRQLDFHTTDIEADARFVSKGREELLDSSRYYYPNLVANSHTDWDDEENGFIVDDAEAAIEGAVPVPTIIAVKQYSTKNPNDDMTGEMTADTSFRLCAGQTPPEDGHWMKTSFESAKWVDEIYVVFAGFPPEEPTEPDTPEEPTEPDETPTGSDITPIPDPEPITEPTKPITVPTEPITEPTEPSTYPTVVPGPTAGPTTGPDTTGTPGPATRPTTQRNGAIRTTRRQTVRPATTAAARATTRMTTRLTTRTITANNFREEPTTLETGQMEQLFVEGYDSLIQWKKDSPDGVTALKKPLVTTNGIRNAVLLFLASFASGAGIMYSWYKKER